MKEVAVHLSASLAEMLCLVLQQMQGMDAEAAGQEADNSEEEDEDEEGVMMRLQSTVEIMQVSACPCALLPCLSCIAR